MDKYYYLVAQLPSLVYDKENPITIAYFLEESEKWLSKSDFVRLKNVQMNMDDDRVKLSKVGVSYIAFESQFRNEIGQWRQSNREGWEYKPSLFPLSMLKEGNPLEIEKKLFHVRWMFIEDLEREHHFDLGYLILYYLKLQVLQKLAQFNKEKGLETYQQISKVTV